MIENISVDGYKCLKGISLATGRLNVLSGPNASGKSSLLQALLLLRQSAGSDASVKGLHLSGPLFEAGTAQDALHPAAEHKIQIKLQIDGGGVEFEFRHDRDDSDAGVPKRILPVDVVQQLPAILYDRNSRFAYLNAERIGPRVSYDLPPDETHISGSVGKFGEYTAAILARASSNDVQVEGWSAQLIENFTKAPRLLDDVDLEEDLKNTQGRLDSVCNVMLGWILPGAVFIAEEFPQSDFASVRFIRDPLATKASVRTTHIGFGLIYSLPIITGALSLSGNGLIIVENPEAHLHPLSQSRIGVFLALIAASGRQVFLETHSDHVINGIRLAIRHGCIKADDVYINFFNRQRSADTSDVTQIRPSPTGRLKPWPKGFFDQIENDLSRL